MRDQQTKNAISTAAMLAAAPFLVFGFTMMSFGWAGNEPLMRFIYPALLMLAGLFIVATGLRTSLTPATNDEEEPVQVQHLACPSCNADMDEGIVRMRSTVIDRLLFTTLLTKIDVWYFSQRNRDFLVIPTGQTKAAFRCTNCGTTVILRGS